MAKIRLSLCDRKNIFLYSTAVENLFINEFLPDAPGDYVKVYLFGLMYAQYGQTMNSQMLAMQLQLSEEEVEEAWVYWEARGLVKRSRVRDENNEDMITVDFVNLVEELYGGTQEPETAEAAAAAQEAEAETALATQVPERAQAAETYIQDTSADEDEAAGEVSMYVSIDDLDFEEEVADRLTDTVLKKLYRKFQAACGRTISRKETGRIEDAIRVYGIKPEVFAYAIDYCLELGKDSIEYIFTVALRWNEEGCRTVDDVKAVLEKHSLRNSWYGKVFKALGWSRLPSPADREMMDRWFDEMDCTIGEVLDACSATAGIREPNLRYVNKVLENRRLEKGGINTRAMYANASQPGASAQTREDSGSDQTAKSPVSRKVLFDYYAFLREEGEEQQKARIKEITEKIPEMKAIYEAETAVNSKLLSIRPGEENRDRRQALRAERLRIDEARKDLLEANGFPDDYLNRKYRCAKCRDSGYTDEGMVCSCARERAEEAFKWIGEINNRK